MVADKDLPRGIAGFAWINRLSMTMIVGFPPLPAPETPADDSPIRPAAGADGHSPRGRRPGRRRGVEARPQHGRGADGRLLHREGGEVPRRGLGQLDPTAEVRDVPHQLRPHDGRADGERPRVSRIGRGPNLFEGCAAGWDRPEKSARPIAEGEIVATAAALALNDAASTGQARALGTARASA